MDIEQIIADAGSNMKKAIAHFENELVKIRAGKASPDIFDGIMVDYYGAPTPINQVANINVVDARTISIQAWEKNMIPLIERAIMASNIGLTPQNDGQQIRIFMPPLTEERRKEFVKRANGEGEQAKIAIRNIRRDSIEKIKKAQKDGTSEDECKVAEERVQGLTDKNIELIDHHCSVKEKELLTV